MPVVPGYALCYPSRVEFHRFRLSSTAPSNLEEVVRGTGMSTRDQGAQRLARPPPGRPSKSSSPPRIDIPAVPAASNAGRGSPRPTLGAVGEASQLVAAALQARIAAPQGQRFATTKTLFVALSSLCGALRLELRRRSVGQVIRWSPPQWRVVAV